MHPIPLIKMSDLQRKTKEVVEAVKEEGVRFVVNRGNVEVVMISVPFYTERLIEKKFKPKHAKTAKKQTLEKVFGIWRDEKKSWREILKELRKEDNKKPFNVYLKELLEWQKREFS